MFPVLHLLEMVLKEARIMATTYRDRLDSPTYGSRLIIFRREGTTGDAFFTYRAKINGVKGYIRRTIKETEPLKAMMVAEQEYEELRIRHKGGYSLKNLSVDKFFESWIVGQKTKLTESRFHWKKSVYQRYVSPFMGHRSISELTKSFLDTYWNFRLTFWESKEGQQRIELNSSRISAKTKSSHNIAVKPSYATLRAESSLINEMLRGAVDAGHLMRTITISPQDALPKEERVTEYRDTFTDDEWRVLTSNLYNYALCRGRWADKRLSKLHKFQRVMMRTFIMLSSSTGARTGELKQCRWKDLRIETRDNGKQVLLISIRPEISKVRRGRTAVAFSDNIIEVLNDYKEASSMTEDEDLIFYSSRKDGSIEPVDLSTQFKTFLKRCPYKDRPEGLRLSTDNKARTLYSLRHFYAIQRLQQNVDVYQLSTSMGTGISQIRNHYGRHISGDAFIDELIKNKSKLGEKVKSDAIRHLVEMVETGVLDEEMAMNAFRKVVRHQ